MKGLFDDTMVKKLTLFEDKVDIAVRAYAQTAALTMENDMKENASWTDRTGRARLALTGSVEAYSQGYRIKLAHGVDYGIMLELAREKKYAIIEPTIRFSGTFVVMPGLQGLLEKIAKGRA